MNFIKFDVTLLHIFLIFAILDNVIGANNKTDDVFSGAQVVNCSKNTEQKMDSLMSLLLPFGTDTHIPENNAEMRKYCNLANKNLPFILGVFKHCSNQFAKTIAKVVFFPIRKHLDSNCKPGKITRTAREIMQIGKCGNKAREPLKVCNAILIDALNGIQLAPVKSRIYMGCCQANAFQQCFRETLEETNGCSRRNIDWTEKWALKMVGGALSMGCGEYFEESDKCTKLIKETPKPQYSKSSKRQKTPILPMIALMESFPDSDQNS